MSSQAAWLPERCCGLCPPVRIQSSRRLSLANHGFFMRGAISLGDAYVDDVAVYGNAFIEAHDGEVELARDLQSYPNLLSEKQAAARLGVARITLLRAREAGRIRFFRIGTRVLYCEEQLREFLISCERNGGKDRHGPGRVAAHSRREERATKSVHRGGQLPRVKRLLLTRRVSHRKLIKRRCHSLQLARVHSNSPRVTN